MGEPPELPERVRVAWKMEEEPVPDVDLVFRDYPLRNDPRPMIGLSVDCPAETVPGKAQSTNCGVCGFCWKR